MTFPVDTGQATGNQSSPNWEALKLEALLAAGEAAVNRARYVFLTISVAGVLILSAEFNLSIPWLRNVLARPGLPEEVRMKIQEFIWKDLYVVSMPILGIKFSAFDLGIIGTTALAVLSVWLFYCARRENHVIGAIAAEALAGTKDRAAYLYSGIAHHFVFMTLTDCDTPEGVEPQVSARRAVRVLRNIPIWVPLFVLGVDLWTLFVPGASGLTPGTLWSHLTPSQHIEVDVRFIASLLIVNFSRIQCRCVAKFDQETRIQLGRVRVRVEGNPCAGAGGIQAKASSPGWHPTRED